MAPITPERHMKLLNMAWNKGVDKEAVEKFLYMNMNGTLQALRIMKSDDFVKGYEMAMQNVKDLMKCTVTFAKIAEMMNGSFPDIPEDFYEE